MPPKYVALIIAASLTTGWLLASMISPPVAELQGLPERRPSRATARDTSVDTPYTEQLHLKLQHAPVRPVPRRNPFVFGARANAPEAAAPAPPQDATASLTELAMPPSVSGPSLRLAGIGSTTTAAGLVRTAVIGDATTVHLVKVGDSVAGYSVVEITDESVTIANAAGAQWRLRFRPPSPPATSVPR